MAARPRKKGNLDLPPHMYADRKADGTVYYQYRMPDGSKHGIGSNKEEAIETAKALNVEINRNKALMNKVLDRSQARQERLNAASPIPPVEAAFDLFRDHYFQKKFSDTTRKSHQQRLNNYKDAWRDIHRINEVKHTDVTAFLNSKPAHAYQKHQALLKEAWQYFVHQGWCTENLAEKTMAPVLPDKVRQPIRFEELMAIREISPDYLQRAIDMALHSLQRREDLTKLKRDSVDLQNNTFTVRQGKTANYKKPIFIQVDMHPELRAAVLFCMESRFTFMCPYLLHYMPAKLNKQVREGKDHHMAMKPGWLSNEFAKYRDKSGIFDHLTAEEKPTFHEIRALGEFRIMERYGKDYAKALAGHATEAMFEHYVGRHKPDEPVKISYR